MLHNSPWGGEGKGGEGEARGEPQREEEQSTFARNAPPLSQKRKEGSQPRLPSRATGALEVGGGGDVLLIPSKGASGTEEEE